MKDLGILMDEDLSFKAHRRCVIQKMRRKAAWTLRTFRAWDMRFMRSIWRSSIQPHQDYGSQIWTPVGMKGDLMEQEGPLRSFTKKVRGLGGLHYWARLSRMCLLSTERRQERYQIIYLWKTLNGLAPDYRAKWTSGFTRRGKMLVIPPRELDEDEN